LSLSIFIFFFFFAVSLIVTDSFIYKEKTKQNPA